MGGVIFLTPRRIGYLHVRISDNIIDDTGRVNTYRTCGFFTEAFVSQQGKIPSIPILSLRNFLEKTP
jgi:hypothetical protein